MQTDSDKKQTAEKGGEGNVTADQRYRDSAKEFAENNDQKDMADAATDLTDKELKEAKAAEKAAESRKKVD